MTNQQTAAHCPAEENKNALLIPLNPATARCHHHQVQGQINSNQDDVAAMNPPETR